MVNKLSTCGNELLTCGNELLTHGHNFLSCRNEIKKCQENSSMSLPGLRKFVLHGGKKGFQDARSGF